MERARDRYRAFWHSVIGPQGMAPAHVGFWEKIMATLAATDEWKAQMEKNYLMPLFMMSADTGKFLCEQYAEIRSVLTELAACRTWRSDRLLKAKPPEDLGLSRTQ